MGTEKATFRRGRVARGARERERNKRRSPRSASHAQVTLVHSKTKRARLHFVLGFGACKLKELGVVETSRASKV